MSLNINELTKQFMEGKKKRKKKYFEEDKGPKGKVAKKLASELVHISCYRNERNLMAFPFCSTSKRKRLKTLTYTSSDGQRYLKVSANHEYGMVKVWDFDILRYALSKAGEINYITKHFPSSVDFSVYECLKAISKNPHAGKNHKWLREALRRLASTTYVGNIFQDDTKLETGFTLISYEIEQEENTSERIRIIFNERIIESVVFHKQLLAINQSVLQEKSGLKKRLLELIQVSKGQNHQWYVRLKQLQKMCAHEGDVKYFKRELLSYQLPWKVEINKNTHNEEIVLFTS